MLAKKLEEIKLLSSENIIKSKIDELIDELINETNLYIENVNEKPIADIIYEKMRETKTQNPELNVRLYILYRNLNMGKISEHEARETFEKYIQMDSYVNTNR